MARIALAIATCRRPAGLAHLLLALSDIQFDGELAIVVVENDEACEGLRICRALAHRYRWPLEAVVETRPGISHARNRAVAEAAEKAPDAIAILDDDEWPERQWLHELVRVQRETGAAVVGGPVLPHFARPADEWDCYRDHYGLDQKLPDGSPCTLYGAGNFLAIPECFSALAPQPFDPAFAFSGGEDLLFFARLAGKGFAMRWAAAAIAHELVPDERMTFAWLNMRQLRRGSTNIAIQRLLAPGLTAEAIRLAKTAGCFAAASGLAVAGLAGGPLRRRAGLAWQYARGRLLGHLGHVIEEYRRRPVAEITPCPEGSR